MKTVFASQVEEQDQEQGDTVENQVESLADGTLFATQYDNVYVKGEGSSIKVGSLSGSPYTERTRENSYFAGAEIRLVDAELKILSVDGEAV